MTTFHFRSALVVAASGLLSASPWFETSASATTYAGPFVGNTVVYSDVQDQDNLFGPPTISGDSLTFTPQSFSVQSQDGGFDFEDGFLSTLITAKEGQAITGFTLTEAGGVRLFGVGTAATQVDVRAFFTMTVLEVDGAPANGQILIDDEILFQANLFDDGPIGQAWIGSASVNVAALAAGAGIDGNVTKLRLTLDNELLAASEVGTLAFIDKKGVSGVTITVPEPTSALLVLGAGALLLRRRLAS